MDRPRILFLACHLPFPPLSGGRLRELELIKRLSARFDVHLMVVSKTFEEDLANAHELERLCRRVEVFAAEPLPPEPERAPQPVQVLRHRCPELTRRVQDVLALHAIDLVHVEGYYLMQHVPADVHVPVLLVEQNIEYELERQRAAAAGVDGEWRSARAMRAEHAAWRRADLLGVLTPEDARAVRAALPAAAVHIVPDGADHIPAPGGREPRIDRPEAPLVAFVGNFAYAPNVDAALHLCGDILPLVEERIPGVHLWLVGNQPPAEVRALASERVRVTGRVADVAPYVDAADVTVCPLRVGGGVKVKTIEALRRGKAHVTTSVGAQGMPTEARDALAIVDEPGAFADAVATLLSGRELRQRTERRAAAAARSLPSWDGAAGALTRAYDDLLHPSVAAAR